MKATIFIHLNKIEEVLETSENIVEYIQWALNHNGLPDSVFLLSLETKNDPVHSTQILVTESLPLMREFVDSFSDCEMDGSDYEVHFQEYNSYEEAYKVALSMREPNPKCYE